MFARYYTETDDKRLRILEKIAQNVGIKYEDSVTGYDSLVRALFGENAV